jgi:hypothetical protein
MSWWRREKVRGEPDIPRPVLDVFRQIVGAPVVLDDEHRYHEIVHSAEISEARIRRVIVRRGVRVSPGTTQYVDVEMGSSVPMGKDITQLWSAIDCTTGRKLRVELSNVPDAYRKVCRVWLEKPVAEQGEFAFEMQADLPLVEVDGFDCIGIKLRGYKHGIDQVKILLSFSHEPSDVRAFLWQSGRVAFAPFSMDRKEVARKGAVYARTLISPQEQQLLIAWFREQEYNEDMLGSQAGGRKLRVLFLAANPLTTSQLDLEGELRSLKLELQAVKYRDSIELFSEVAVQPDDLIRHVRAYKPAVIHFSGHGSPQGIILRTEQGAQPVPGPSLRRFLANRGVELVVLNSCYSKDQAEVILGAVETVVGTTASVGDEAARRFTVAFYRSLGNGLSIREAFRDGSDAVALYGLLDVFHADGNLDRLLVDPQE